MCVPLQTNGVFRLVSSRTAVWCSLSSWSSCPFILSKSRLTGCRHGLRHHCCYDRLGLYRHYGQDHRFFPFEMSWSMSEERNERQGSRCHMTCSCLWQRRFVGVLCVVVLDGLDAFFRLPVSPHQRTPLDLIGLGSFDDQACQLGNQNYSTKERDGE